ncbi:MAG: acyltransferase [Propionibacteriaceae bacterium]|jgi:peptidoglycan/LPS O-acetylase OafA/YrhL|nr:acyltransferase [Propionibacteriaceae bacterium]
MNERNHLIDFARVFSMAIVVSFHALLYFITDSAGQFEILPWAPGPILWALSWVLAIIPIFFVAAGYANALTYAHTRVGGQSYLDFLATRVGRLLGPFTLFTCLFALLSSIPAWLGFSDDAIGLSQQFAMLFWFLVVYLGLQALTPVLVKAFDRFGWLTMLPFLLGTITVDLSASFAGNAELAWLNLAFVWPMAHQWGIAYERGWFRGWRIRTLLVLIALSIGLIALLVFGFGYPPAAVAWADCLVANLLPPTFAALIMGFMQTCALGALERLGVGKQLSATASRRLRLANALTFSVYLWHIPMITLAGGIMAGLALLFPAFAPIVLSQVIWLLLTWALIVAIVPFIARLEFKLIPNLSGSARATQTIVGFGLLFIGIFLAWRFGVVIHPRSPASTIAVALLFSGIAISRHAVSAEFARAAR